MSNGLVYALSDERIGGKVSIQIASKLFIFCISSVFSFALYSAMLH